MALVRAKPVWLGALAVLIGLTAMTVTASAQDPRTRPPGLERRFRIDFDRERPAERAPADVREGGIPRAALAPQEPQVGPDGTFEGMPQLRPRRDERRIAPRWAPPRIRDRWQLGVFARNTDTGAVVTQVLPGSAARRAGLEPGDLIVAVRGFQIGWVEDRLYPLGDELQRQADAAGTVSLLVQNVRNRRLANIPIRLDRRR